MIRAFALLAAFGTMLVGCQDAAPANEPPVTRPTSSPDESKPQGGAMTATKASEKPSVDRTHEQEPAAEREAETRDARGTRKRPAARGELARQIAEGRIHGTAEELLTGPGHGVSEHDPPPAEHPASACTGACEEHVRVTWTIPATGQEPPDARVVQLLDALMTRRQNAFRACHERARGRTPGSDGTIIAALTLHPRGVVRDVTLQDSTVEPARIATCAFGVIQRFMWRRDDLALDSPLRVTIELAFTRP